MTGAGQREAAALGVDPGRLDALLRRIRQAVDETPLPSMQVAVARHGRLVAFETFGDATNGDRYVLQSVGRLRKQKSTGTRHFEYARLDLTATIGQHATQLQSGVTEIQAEPGLAHDRGDLCC